jgi:hypothetical protein
MLNADVYKSVAEPSKSPRACVSAILNSDILLRQPHLAQPTAKLISSFGIGCKFAQSVSSNIFAHFFDKNQT